LKLTLPQMNVIAYAEIEARARPDGWARVAPSIDPLVDQLERVGYLETKRSANARFMRPTILGSLKSRNMN